MMNRRGSRAPQKSLDSRAMPVPSPYSTKLAAIPVREAVVDVLGSQTHYW